MLPRFLAVSTRRRRFASLSLIFCAILMSARAVAGQLIAAKDGRVVMGHVGLNSTSTDEHQKFWSTLGGTLVNKFNRGMFEFVNVYVSHGHGSGPKGGTVGTAVDHIAFRVPDFRALLVRMEAIGYRPFTTSSKTFMFDSDLNANAAFLMGPDGIKVEVVETAQTSPKVAIDHLHYVGPNAAAMRDWYVTMLGAKSGKRGSAMVAELPGIVLMFGPSSDALAGTAGRVLDHVTFEIKDLAAFCDRLQASGIRLDRPYSKVSAMNLGVAFLTDPWGTSVELTEGYDQITPR
jgi:catechol 2,3-dioxygenase-like lactoylglutathione lyase family enzyme